MADSLHYTATPTHHYVPNVVAHPAMPQDPAAQRKRPKYTRSKTGCLTCRARKVKCDETKPTCVRCSHYLRECTWPEVLTRKKPKPRREPPPPIHGTETPQSTVGSSGVSDSPATRGPTPPRRGGTVEIPPMVSCRHSDPHVNIPVTRQPAVALFSTSSYGYAMHSNNTRALPAIPEIAASYTSQPQYLRSYPSHHYSQSHSTIPVPDASGETPGGVFYTSR